MNPSSMSRRHWIGAGLATCGYLAAAQCQALADETSLLGYTKPGPITLRGLAPQQKDVGSKLMVKLAGFLSVSGFSYDLDVAL
jgi:hypothetical protein